jgi:hypothetical protein
MPSTPAPTETLAPMSAHGEIDCADAEALLADALAECSRLRAENRLLNRRLEIAIGQKNVAIDEAVHARSL